MVLLKTVEEFAQQATQMVQSAPRKARLTTKYKKEGPVFTMKITDGPTTYSVKITRESDFRQAQRVMYDLMHMMAN